MKIILLLAFLALLISSCKKDEPKVDNFTIARGRLLSYYDDSSLSNATVKLYYTNGNPTVPDEIVTTDILGYFDYKKVEGYKTVAIPSLSGWWCGFNYILNDSTDFFENDSIIYLFHKGEVKINFHYQTPEPPGFSGKFMIFDAIQLPKMNSESYWTINADTIIASDTGTYSFTLSTLASVHNSAQLWTEAPSYLPYNGWFYTYFLTDTAGFYSDTTGNLPEVDLYY